MRTLINKHSATLFALCALILNGCYTSSSTSSSVYHYSNYYYTPSALDSKTIDTPVHIEVVLEQIDLDIVENYVLNELDENIKKSFINELETAFSNVVDDPEESEIILNVTVNNLKKSDRMTFFNFFPFARVGVFLLGAPVFVNHGFTDVTVSAYKANCNSLISKYKSSSKVSGWTGFYYGNEYFSPCYDSYVVYKASRKAMDEIKSKIINETYKYLLNKDQ